MVAATIRTIFAQPTAEAVRAHRHRRRGLTRLGPAGTPRPQPQGPRPADGPDHPFQGRPLDVEDTTPADPYTNLPHVDLDTITAYPTLPVRGREVPSTPTVAIAQLLVDVPAPAAEPDPYAGLADIDLNTITAFPDSSTARRRQVDPIGPSAAHPPRAPADGRQDAKEPDGPVPDLGG
ncbi:hypothetical protein [Kitasatospora cathayae]|uniref:Uncharacterized protein n=1 Tax=Kitasatospora cathayae TaxID=3004092 RepID=A0ABY7QGX3_9ACTN|nr:hypothetical protein [Kitasatospora sp. HUAS 3-15]WBP92055.1 hypothetical protein O1G21_40430 [Kitasatospora sp. HUAS 3-15]